MTRRTRMALTVGLMALAPLASSAFAQTSRVFVTSTSSNGNLGGLAGADATCNDLATTAGLGGTWVAWLSTSTVNARDRLDPTSGPFVRAADLGTVIGNDIPDLTDGLLIAPVSLDENGSVPSGAKAWTGTGTNGTLSISTCGDWTSTGGQGIQGRVQGGGSDWTIVSQVSCANAVNFGHFYCFEVPSAPEVPAADQVGLSLLMFLLAAGIAYIYRSQWAG